MDAADLLGTWTNELNSTLEITQVANGTLSGTYTTAVSSNACAQGAFTVQGCTDIDSGGGAVSFCVCWKNPQADCRAVTAWSGTLIGPGQLRAFWLLTSTPESPAAAWADTQIGEDLFWQGSQPAAQAGLPPGARRAHP